MFDQNKHNLLNHHGLSFTPISRLIFQSKPSSVEVTSTSPEKAEIVDKRVEALKIAKDQAQTSIRTANNTLRTVEGQLTPATEKYLTDYFQSSIERFDKDKDGKISEVEAKEYQQKMLEKTTSLIKEYLPTEQAKNAKEAKDNAAKNVETPEISAKNVSEIKEIAGQLDLSTSIGEFQTLQTQNNSFQSSVSQSLESIQSFHKSLADFQQAEQGFSAFSHAYDQFFEHAAIDAKVAALKAKLETTKTNAEAKLTDLKAKKTLLDANSEKIKTVIAAERKRLIDERDAKLEELKSTEEDQEEKVSEKKQKYQQIKTKQDELLGQQTKLKVKQDKHADLQKQWEETQQKEQLDARKTAFTESHQDAIAELAALQIILEDEHLSPEQKEQVQKEYDQVLARQQASDANLKLVTERIDTGKKVTRALSAEEKANLDQANQLSAYLEKQVNPAVESTATTVSRLEELKFQYATQASEVSDYYNKKVDQMDKVNETVSDFALASAVGRDKSIGALESAVTSLKGVNIDSTGRLGSLLSLPQGLLHGIGEGFHDASQWLDKNSGLLMDNAEESHLLTQVAGAFAGVFGGVISDKSNWGDRLVAQTAGAFSGFLSGGVELIGGIYTMAAHPIETAKGLGVLVGRDPQTGDITWDNLKTGWGHLGSALVGGDEWAKGHYGTSVGKFAFNVMSMFVGAGEAGAVGKAGAAGKLARVAAIEEALAKGVNLTRFTGRGAQILQFAKTIAIESTPKFAKTAYIEGAEAVGVLGKTAAVGKSLAVSTFEGAKAIPGLAKATPKAVFNIYKELLMSPVSAIRGIGRLAKELPRLHSEGIFNAARASKIAEAGEVIAAEGAQYSKARETITNYIHQDPHLTALFEQGEHGAKSAEAQAALRLSREEPALFNSYNKVQKATAKLEEYASEMIVDTQARLKKIQENQEIQYEHTEHQRLSEKYDAAKAKLEKAGNVKTTPEYISAEAELADAEKILKNFEIDPKRMGKADQYYAAEKTKQELASLQTKKQELLNNYVGTSNESLAAVEREIAEARAVKASSPIAITDSPEFIEEALESFEKACKSGKAEEIDAAIKAFGTVEKGSELFQQLEAIKHKVNEVDYSSNPKDLHEVFQRHQSQLLEDYNLYNQALRGEVVEPLTSLDTATATTAYRAPANGPTASSPEAVMSEIRARHPAWKEAFDQMDIRNNYLLHNNQITHGLAAVKIQVELADLVKPTMKAEEAATVLQKRYQGRPMGADAQARPVSEVTLADGKAYQVRLEGSGKVKLINPEGEIVPTLAEAAADAKAGKAIGKVKPTSTPSTTATTIDTAVGSTPLDSTAAVDTAAADLANKKPASMRRDEALKLLDSSNDEWVIRKKAARGLESDIRSAEKAYTLREQSGRTTPAALKGLENKITTLKENLAKNQAKIADLEQVISTARKDKWVARAEASTGAAVDYITSPLRSAWLKRTTEKLLDMAGLPGDAARAVANFLKEQALSKYQSIKLFSEKGLQIARSLRNLWEHTRDNKQSLSALYNKILVDQYTLLGQLSKAVDYNADKFQKMSIDEKITALETAWSGAAASNAEQAQLYTEAEVDYYQDKKIAIRDTIDGIRDQEDLTADQLREALDAQLGPAGGNDTGKAYALTVDGITLKVDADGERTYLGLDKWIIDKEKKALVGQAFRQISEDYADLNPQTAAKLNQGKPFGSVADLKKHIEEKLTALIVDKIKDQTLTDELRVVSKSRTTEDKPNFIATISKTGKITLDIQNQWTEQVYAHASGQPNPLKN